MRDIYHPFAEIDRLNVELEHARDGERVAMTQCSNAQAEITGLRAELSQARAWAGSWKGIAKWYRTSIVELRDSLAYAIAAQPCGHALSYIVSSREGTSYCQACCDSGAIEAQLRNELTEERESRREEVRDLDELIKRFRANIARKDAALAMIEEHLPLHDIDEYGYHSPGCDACAIQSELIKAA